MEAFRPSSWPHSPSAVPCSFLFFFFFGYLFYYILFISLFNLKDSSFLPSCDTKKKKREFPSIPPVDFRFVCFFVSRPPRSKIVEVWFIVFFPSVLLWSKIPRFFLLYLPLSLGCICPPCASSLSLCKRGCDVACGGCCSSYWGELQRARKNKITKRSKSNHSTNII